MGYAIVAAAGVAIGFVLASVITGANVVFLQWEVGELKCRINRVCEYADTLSGRNGSVRKIVRMLGDQ